MKIFDSIYGEYSTPKSLERLIKSPVVQRLRWVALSNIPSLTYPMIAGVSRYSHSLGVAHLGDTLGVSLGLSETDRTSLICAGLLHDAGMPPLGHITEEAMSSLGIKFEHEESLKMILLEEGRRFQQMPDGEKVGVTEALMGLHADAGVVFSSITGDGPLGALVSSTMDIDNIDNVIRLYRLIFPSKEGYNPVSIAHGYFSGTKEKDECRSQWEHVRLELYTKLMFSIEDFVQKASMKRMIRAYLACELAQKDEQEVIDSLRFLNDYQFLNKILETLGSHEIGRSFYSGKYDRLIAHGWVNSISKEELNLVRDALEDDGYYFDFIPDKRSKSNDAVKERGALIGLFCGGKYGKSKDLSFTDKLVELIPSLRLDFTPSAIGEVDQMSLI